VLVHQKEVNFVVAVMVSKVSRVRVWIRVSIRLSLSLVLVIGIRVGIGLPDVE